MLIFLLWFQLFCCTLWPEWRNLHETEASKTSCATRRSGFCFCSRWFHHSSQTGWVNFELQCKHFHYETKCFIWRLLRLFLLFHPKKSPSWWKVRWNVVVHKTFLELHSKTELQHSAKQLEQLETWFKMNQINSFIQLVHCDPSPQKPWDLNWVKKDVIYILSAVGFVHTNAFS